MAVPRRRRERPPLDAEKLRELALAYVGRFATTRARLSTYLERKIRERALAAMIRAGHRFALASAILSLEPGSDVDIDMLAEKR